MRNIDNINFRYRGPSESQKNNKITHDTLNSINEIIEEVEILLNKTEQFSTEILYNIRRRGYYNGTTED